MSRVLALLVVKYQRGHGMRHASCIMYDTCAFLKYFFTCDTVRSRSRIRIPARAAGELLSPRSTFCADSYFGILSTPMLAQQHVKNPGHSAKSAGGRLQLNTHTPYVCGFA